MRSYARNVALSAAFLVCAQKPILAQSDSPNKTQSAGEKSSQPKAAGSTSAGTVVLAPVQDQSDQATPSSGSVIPNSGEIKDAATGLPWLGTSSTPLRWGDFYIGQFEFVGLHDHFNPSGTDPSEDLNLFVFGTSFVFDHTFWKSRLVLQYLPQLAIVNGDVEFNGGTNNTFSIGSKFELTPRLSMTLQNVLSQVSQNQIVPQNYFATSWTGGATSQNNFLKSNGDFLSDTASASFQYGLSPRTFVTLTPSFEYAYNNSTSDSPTSYSVNGLIYQASASISHALTPHRQIGASESFEYVQERSTASTDSRFLTTSVFYSEQLSPSWWISGSVGATHQDASDQAGGNVWSATGSASLVGSFSRVVGLGVHYSRDTSFNNYINSRLSDRADASLGFHLGQRAQWSTGVGYFRETGADPRTTGKYAITSLQYRVYGSTTAFVSYAYTFQTSNTEQLSSGGRNTVAFGVRWQPPAYPAK